MMQSTIHKQSDHGLFWSNSLPALWTEHLLVLRAYSGLSPNPSFGFVSPIRHFVHVFKNHSTIDYKCRKGEAITRFAYKFVSYTWERKKKMVIMQMCPPLMSIQMKTILFMYFGQTIKVSILDGTGKGSCPTHAIEKNTLSKLSLHCFWPMSLRGKILLPPKSTEHFPLIFMQLQFCPRFVWTQHLLQQ